MRNLHKKLRQTQKERDRIKAKPAKVIECQGIDVDSDTNADLHSITQSEAFQVMEKFPRGHIFESSRSKLPLTRMFVECVFIHIV